MVKSIIHFRLQDAIEPTEIHEHSGHTIHFPGDRYVADILVAVELRRGPRAEHTLVLVVAPITAPVAVRGVERDSTCQGSTHATRTADLVRVPVRVVDGVVLLALDSFLRRRGWRNPCRSVLDRVPHIVRPEQARIEV